MEDTPLKQKLLGFGFSLLLFGIAIGAMWMAFPKGLPGR